MNYMSYVNSLGVLSDSFHKNLISHLTDTNSQLFKFVSSRKLSNESIHSFNLGYIPDDVEGYLSKWKAKYNLELPSLDLTRFHNRIVFPICNASNHVTGFVARALCDDPYKYINTSDTDFFRKRSSLFGLNLAWRDILATNNVYITEGQFDVISMHSIGVRNTVSVFGTSLTRDHLYSLYPFCNHITLMFDGDTAGQNAISSAVVTAADMGFTVSVIHLENGEDPDNIVKRGANPLSYA